MSPTPLDLYESFASHNVRYLLIGGAATLLHGVNRTTVDVDVFIEPTLGNAQAVLDAMEAIGLGTACLTSAEDLLADGITVFEDVLPVDVHTKPPGVDFQTAWARRCTGTAHGVQVHYLAIEDLVASKRAAGRPQDLDDIAALKSLGEETG